MITFVPCNIFERIWHSEFILLTHFNVTLNKVQVPYILQKPTMMDTGANSTLGQDGFLAHTLVAIPRL